MEDKTKISYHFSKLLVELEENIAEKIASKILQHTKTISIGDIQENLLTPKEACKKLRISLSHFYKIKKQYPKFPVCELGGVKRYRLTDVETYFKKQ